MTANLTPRPTWAPSCRFLPPLGIGRCIDHRSAFLLAALCLLPQAALALPPGPIPQWIWTSRDCALGAPVELRRTFELQVAPRKATVWVLADDRATLLLNDHEVLTAEGTRQIRPVDVTRWLQPGRNELICRAVNQSGSAGVALFLTLESSTGSREVLVSELQARYAGRLPWVRCTRTPRRLALPPGEGLSSALKPRIIEALGSSGLQRLSAAAGLRMNARLLGVYDFQGGATRYRALLGAGLAAAGPEDLLMCHPARPGAADPRAAADPIGRAREAEFAVLADPALDDLLAGCGLRLARLESAAARPS